MKKIIFLIPAFNEEKNIKKVILNFKKFGKVLVDKARTFMKKNPNTVAKMKSNVEQTPVEKLPMFKKLSNRYVSEGVDFSGLNKGTDITKGMMKK